MQPDLSRAASLNRRIQPPAREEQEAASIGRWFNFLLRKSQCRKKGGGGAIPFSFFSSGARSSREGRESEACLVKATGPFCQLPIAFCLLTYAFCLCLLPFALCLLPLAFGRQGKARQGKARQGKARQGKARQDNGRQGKGRERPPSSFMFCFII